MRSARTALATSDGNQTFSQAGLGGLTPKSATIRVTKATTEALVKCGAIDRIALLLNGLAGASSLFLVGAGLSISGAAFQGVFRNPLADPYLLGAAAGAGAGASDDCTRCDNTSPSVGCVVFMTC